MAERSSKNATSDVSAVAGKGTGCPQVAPFMKWTVLVRGKDLSVSTLTPDKVRLAAS